MQKKSHEPWAIEALNKFDKAEWYSLSAAIESTWMYFGEFVGTADPLIESALASLNLCLEYEMDWIKLKKIIIRHMPALELMVKKHNWSGEGKNEVVVLLNWVKGAYGLNDPTKSAGLFSNIGKSSQLSLF